MKQPSVVEHAHALCSSTRVHIFGLLGETGLSVTEIASRTGLSTSTTCFHLGQLAQVGLVESKRRGRSTIYRWSDTRLSFRVEKVTPTSPTTTRSTSA